MEPTLSEKELERRLGDELQTRYLELAIKKEDFKKKNKTKIDV